MDQAEKVRINRLRRVATRQGYKLHKTRRYDPCATDYGTFRLVQNKGRRTPPSRILTLDEVEEFLTHSPHGHGSAPA